MLYPELETPCVIIDENTLDANIERFHRFAGDLGIQVRPHIKTHKLPYVAQKQMRAGSVGITCQKIGEAEVFAAAGFSDILITYNILGVTKISRLLALARQVAQLTVVADSTVVLEGLSNAFSGGAHDLNVLIECDTGAGRCGVQTPEQAVSLAQTIAGLPGLRLRGLMTYPAPYSEERVQQWFSEAAVRAADAGISLEVFSSGGTPSMWELAKTPIVNEYRIGTYVYQDRSQVAAGACGVQDCALSVLATVISTPVPGRVIVDAGSKALTSDLLGQNGYGQVVGFPDSQVVSLSEEHGILSFPPDAEQPAVGDRLQIIPNHACPVSNLFDEVHFVRDTHFTHSQAVAARGKVV